MRALVFTLLIGFFCSLFALESSGFIKKINGEVSIQREGKELKVQLGDMVYEKDIISTSQNSSVGIIFKDNTLVSLGANTEFIIEQYIFEPANQKESFIARLTKGTMTCLTGLMSKINPDAMKIKAKTASIGIRGTHFAISVD